MNSHWKLLALAAREGESDRLRKELETAGRSFEILPAADFVSFAAQLAHYRVDAIVLSTHLPRLLFSDVLAKWNTVVHRPPLLVWAREVDGPAVVGAMRAGATRVIFQGDDLAGALDDLISAARRGPPESLTVPLAHHRAELFSALAGGIAHDLNNILAPVIMAAGMLREQALARDELELVDTIEHSAQRAASVVRQVLTFARGSSNCGVVVQSHLLLREIARLASEVFHAGISIRADLPNNLWPVVGDPAAIHQAVVQVMVNARDATPEGGLVILSAQNITVREVPASAVFDAAPGEYVRVEIEDSGVGLPLETVDSVWEPYIVPRADGAAGGLGFGAVTGVLRSHGGFGRVRVPPGRGTVVELYFPRAALEAHRAAKSEPRTPEAAGKILLVDDENEILQLSQRILRRAGFDVLVASDGREALSVFVRHRAEIGLVVTDLAMPGMNGFTLIWALRRAKPDLRVMVATGEGSDSNIRELEQMGVRQVLLKPFAPKKLLESVNAALVEPVELAPDLFVHEAAVGA